MKKKTQKCEVRGCKNKALGYMVGKWLCKECIEAKYEALKKIIKNAWRP